MAGGTPSKATVQRKEKRINQIKFLLENMSSPEYMPNDSMTSLNETFNVNSDLAGFDPVGITMSIMNFDTGRLIKRDTDTAESFYSIATFLNRIQMYLPLRLRQDKRSHVRLWCNTCLDENHLSEEMRDYLRDIEHWFWDMRTMIQNDLSNRYLLGGKIQQLEILKRRFKNGWSEKIETVNETHNTVQGGLDINISFEDYDEEEHKDQTTTSSETPT